MLRPMRLILTVVFVAPFFATSGLWADTVFLKNGAYIDGIVTTRSEKSILINIGSIGKIEIATEVINHIEKNSRTGSRERVSVDTRELELPESLKSKDADGASSADSFAEENDKDKTPVLTSSGDEKDEDRPSVKDADKEDEEDEDDELDPKVREEIEQAVSDLERQKSKFRWRAERKLGEIGEPAVPFLLPLARSSSELTRTIVMRFFAEHGTDEDEVIEAILSGLDDNTVYVRDYSVQALRRLTGRNFGYRPTRSPASRDAAREKWNVWWEAEKEKRNAKKKKK